MRKTSYALFVAVFVILAGGWPGSLWASDAQSVHDLKSPQARAKFMIRSIRDPYVRDLRAVGKKKLADKAHTELSKCIAQYSESFRLRDEGLTFKEIGKRLGVSSRTIANWVDRGRIPRLLLNTSPSYSKMRSKGVALPDGEAESFAYFLGTYVARVRPGAQMGDLRFSDKDPRLAELLSKEVSTLPCLNADAVSNGSNCEVRIVSTPLNRDLKKLSRLNRVVLWEHLVTDAERLRFLQGCFDWGSSVALSSNSISFQKTGSRTLVLDVARLLTRFDIVPTVKLGEKSFLSIFEQPHVERFAKLVGYRSSRKDERLQQIVARKSKRKRYSLADYDKVQTAAAIPGSSLREIERKTDIPYDQVRDWVRRGKKPDEVNRRERLAELTRGMPDPDVVGLLYRNDNIDSATARRIARIHTPESLRVHRSRLVRLGIEQKQQMALLASTSSPFGEKQRQPGHVVKSEKVDRKRVIEVFNEREFEMLAAVEAKNLAGESNNFFDGMVQRTIDNWDTLTFPEFTAEKTVAVIAKGKHSLANEVRWNILSRISDKAKLMYYHHLLNEGIELSTLD